MSSIKVKSTELSVLVNSSKELIKCSYDYKLVTNTSYDYEDDMIVLPNYPFVIVHFNLFINGFHINNELNPHFTNILSQSLSNGKFWKDINYTVDEGISENKNTVKILLKCNFLERWGDIIVNSKDGLNGCAFDEDNVAVSASGAANNSGISFRQLQELNIEARLFLNNDDPSRILNHLNYLFSSVFLSLELQLPFVFSFYGRLSLVKNSKERLNELSMILTKDQTKLFKDLILQLNRSIYNLNNELNNNLKKILERNLTSSKADYYLKLKMKNTNLNNHALDMEELASKKRLSFYNFNEFFSLDVLKEIVDQV
ncbi:hypothetical protein PACTADRAFT_542 [Pachysolen tannophilus NRRL Y-2460]|uniref:Uncharacterized protein n=1 Tax=Pachysolen tannophilus NRRL Y-2460 TaxID=669874 RepID=A0A1E4U226_PACTA|nr:hypothetical protein PACTADRAFT_542 [Pachysolen tannophilus NRRL Y-2460]